MGISAFVRSDTAIIAQVSMTTKGDCQIVNEPELGLRPQTPRGKDASERLRGRVAIAKAIIEARLRKNWTQDQLAQAAGTKQSRISELESARGNPTLETIERVALVLDLELSLNAPRGLSQATPACKKTFAMTYILTQYGPSHCLGTEAERFEEAPIPSAIAARMVNASKRQRTA